MLSIFSITLSKKSIANACTRRRFAVILLHLPIVVGITNLFILYIMENQVSYADVAAMVGRDGGCNNWMNNPFMYLIWLAFFGGGGNGFGFGRNGQGLQDAEIMGQLNAIRQTMADNQNANALGAGIAGNHEQLHGIMQAICNASTSNQMSLKDLAAQIASCCCEQKTTVLNQTNQLQAMLAALTNSMSQGFAQVGYATQQQTCDITNACNANTQRILDRMCCNEVQALRDQLAQASQNAQTATILAAIPKATTA